MATDAQTAANRKNAAKSTGPKTPEGKAASSRNALSHGMAAHEFMAFPDEDAAAYEASLVAWSDDLKPAGPVESALVELACWSRWRLNRCARHETSVLAYQARRAFGEHRRAQLSRASELGRRLLFEPIDRCAGPCAPPEMVERMAFDPILDPAPTVNELESFAEGVDWMIMRWLELEGILGREGFWHYPEKCLATRLLGRRPEDVLSDPAVGWLFAAAQACHPEALTIWNELRIATCGRYDRPVYLHRTDFFGTCCPATAEEGRKGLKEIVDEELTRLKAKKEARLDLLGIQDRAEAADRSRFDGGPTAALRLRYESAAARTMHRALDELRKLRKDAAEAEPRAEPATENKDLTRCQKIVNVESEGAETGPEPDAPNEPNPAPSGSPRRRGDVPNGPGLTASERPERGRRDRRRAQAPRSARP